MSMSRDRVRFFLPYKYFQTTRTSQSTMSRATCIDVLTDSFGGQRAHWGRMMELYVEGFWIICRPSQFARFIIYRCQANECINGIKDLKAELIGQQDFYSQLARAAGVHIDRESLQRIVRALGYDPAFASHNIPNAFNGEIDVSAHQHKPR